MLIFECPSCKTKLQVPDEHAGKKMKCPKCQQLARVPKQDDADDEAITAEPAEALPSAKETAMTTPEHAKASKAGRSERGREDDDDDAEDDEDDRPRRRGKKSRSSDDAKVAAKTGAGIGMVLLILGVSGCFVVGAGAVLIALLVPAMVKVREVAARTQCQNNLKHTGLAYFNWGSAFPNRVFPVATWTTELAPYWETDGTVPLTCPAKAGAEAAKNPAAAGANSDYAMNGFIGVPRRLPNPANTILVLEWSDAGPFTAEANQASDTAYFAKVQARHEKRANILFADGHVDAVDPAVYSPTKAANTAWNVNN